MDNFRQTEINQAIASLETNQSLLIVGDEGSGKSAIAAEVRSEFKKRGWTVAIAEYTGSAKNTLIEIADQLGCDTCDPNTGKPLTADGLRDAIADYLYSPKTILICDDAHRYPSTFRYWLQDCLGDRALLLMLAVNPPRKDLFLKMPRIYLQALESLQIREIMIEEATEIGLKLPASELALLEQRCGGNPFLARRVVREQSLNLAQDQEGDRVDYIDGTPFLIATLSMVGVVRLIGLGLGNRSLYIIGGIFTISAITLRILVTRANSRNKTRLE
ncbi:ATP-binding protein [Pseudanabaena sp. UWO311]|uniref:ATP-binding protein n=1 Tax=Pseudanabaena sp. UWO311 TaxID=2487337 RepID=UPI001157E134|nr:ATP-binding protein [Pseudanabaena sp. UWO311]TYQ29176.1 ATP-binding protein [Pseudanabaena sp. UWO311]